MYNRRGLYCMHDARRNTHECKCMKVVWCYKAVATWCFSPLDDTQTHTHGHAL